jgi:hypothetical protein
MALCYLMQGSWLDALEMCEVVQQTLSESSSGSAAIDLARRNFRSSPPLPVDPGTTG